MYNENLIIVWVIIFSGHADITYKVIVYTDICLLH